MKKFKFFVVLLLFTQSVGAFSQDGKDTLKNEVLFSTSFGHNGMYYSRRISDKLWLRTGVGLYYQYSYNLPHVSYNAYPSSLEQGGVYLVLGVIKNKEIRKLVELSYGIEFYYEYVQETHKSYNPMYTSNDQTNMYISRKAGIKLIGGFFYKISNNFMLGTRFKPSFYYATSKYLSGFLIDTRFVDYFVIKFRF